MNENKPTIWKATLIAPLGVPLSIVFVVAVESVLNDGIPGLRDLPATMFLVFLFGLPISYGVMLFLGLPYLIWLRSKKQLTWVFVCIGSIVFGSTIWSGYWQLSPHSPPFMSTIPTGAFIGFVVGVTFCLVAKLPSGFRRHR